MYDTDTVGGYGKCTLFTYFPSNNVSLWGILQVTLIPYVQIPCLLTEFLRRVTSALLFKVESTKNVTDWWLSHVGLDVGTICRIH